MDIVRMRLFRDYMSALENLSLTNGGVQMSSIELSGFGSRTIHPIYEGVDQGIPLLKRFYFLFTRSNGGAIDHHINQIMVQPNGPFTDLAPNADPNVGGTNPDEGKIRLSYQDKAGNDEYFFSVSHETVHGPTRFRMRDVGAVGEIVRPLPPPPSANMTFVIIGFQLFFTGNRDHHIDEVGIFQQGNLLTVRFNDRNDDDTFAYVVDYTWLDQNLTIATGQNNGLAHGGESVPVPTLGTKLLRGFLLNFTNSDHELRDIGILLTSSSIDVFYGDRNADDRFSWTVRWASLRPQLPTFPTLEG